MSLINYIKTVWTNGQTPAINATNLNKIEQGIKDACDNADSCGYESGTESGWTWKRYSDGTFDAWYKGTVACNGMTVFGSGTGLYAAEKFLDLSNIFDFSISDATVSMTTKNTAGSGFVTIWRAFYTTTSLISSSVISFRVVGTAANAGNVTYDLHIHGTWS